MSHPKADRTALRKAVRARQDQIIADLSELVALPSLLGQEQSAQNWMAGKYRTMGLDVETVAIDIAALHDKPGFSPPVIDNYNGRENVVGIHTPATTTGRSLILNGHIDVVPTGPAELWQQPPFTPHVIGDWLYGRGAGDMKAGLIASCHALSALHDVGLEPAAPVILQSVVEEECTGNGALACLHAGYRADCAIIPEPFNQTLMTAQLGVMWFQLHVTGSPAHVLDTSAGSNAIEAAYGFFETLKEVEELWNHPGHRHEAYGAHSHPVNFNLGKISGGEWASTVPTTCDADIRIGFYPGMDMGEIQSMINDVAKSAIDNHPACKGATVTVEYRGFQAEGCVMDETHPMMTMIGDLHREVTGNMIKNYASTATTDARFFQIYGNIPATCYGPKAERIHGIDERVSISSVMEVTEVLALFIADWCGTNPQA
ncbi:ArgE/DapE family deacylase [Thalassospira sp. MCCC 1A01428]|uniref:M20 family metallopeptidase n=1 Tax=Thalassospira sp. MCCC 1A01428 TaxID=1470575 RepID=UPI000A200971|nr:ArgE/DapE family deacylase [Thalassospira sp. MCCC 1A01428]OSQ42201.1 acetylornithine deacetylase [Thalassospira sp. MCCC 1A01428]